MGSDATFSLPWRGNFMWSHNLHKHATLYGGEVLCGVFGSTFPPWELGVKCHFCVVISYAPSTHCKLVLNLLHKLCVSWWLWAIKSAPGEEELVVCSK